MPDIFKPKTGYIFIHNLKMAKLNVFLAVVAVALGIVGAVDGDEKNGQEVAEQIFQNCAEKFGVAVKDLKGFGETGDISTLDPCIHACVFKNTGVITEAGLFDPDSATAKISKFFYNEEDTKKIIELFKTCSSVNEQSVTDGAKGCERSKLLLACFLDKKMKTNPPSSE